MVTSLNFITIHPATMLCHFSQLRNGATNEYVTVPERIVQNEEAASRNEGWTKIKPSFGPTLS